VPGIDQTSRRTFLRYSGGMVGASLLAPYWVRSVIAQSVSTFDFYISPTGNDANAGTSASPWAFSTLLNSNQPHYNSTIASNRAKMAGKRVGVLPGTYSLGAIAGTASTGNVPGDWSSPQYQVPAGTGASSPTVLQSTVPLGAILDGQLTNESAQNPGGVPLLGSDTNGNAKYITIDGFEIKNAAAHGIMIGGMSAISGTQVPGIVVRNCYIHAVTDSSTGGNAAGITIYSCNGALVQNCYVTDIHSTSNRETGIETWNSVNTIIEYTTIILTAPEAGAFYAKNINNSCVTVRNCYFDLSGASGGQYCLGWDLTPLGAATSKAYNNILVGGAALLQTVGTGMDPASSAEKVFIYNNTLVGTGPNYGGIQCFGTAGTMHAYNNVFAASVAGGRGVVDFNASAPALMDYNLYQLVLLGLTSNGTTNYPAISNTLSAWQASLPGGCVGRDAHAISGAPTFAGGGTLPAQAYKLASGSRGKGSGSSDGTVSGSACDMGAWGGASPPTQVGCNFKPGSALPATGPAAPSLSVT
jgi:Right handed beta helix region